MLNPSVKHKEDDFFIHTVELNARQQAEEDFYRNSEAENASSDLHKSLFIRVQSLLFFEDILNKYPITFTGNFLELGGGFGYLSSYIKKKNNDATVFYSDVSREAVKKSWQYEDFFQAKSIRNG
jgi:methylase of polypeptide subunit release factors